MCGGRLPGVFAALDPRLISVTPTGVGRAGIGRSVRETLAVVGGTFPGPLGRAGGMWGLWAGNRFAVRSQPCEPRAVHAQQNQHGGSADLCVRSAGRLSGDTRPAGQKQTWIGSAPVSAGRPSKHTLRLGPVTGWRGGGPLCPLRWAFVGRPRTDGQRTTWDRLSPPSFRCQAIVRGSSACVIEHPPRPCPEGAFAVATRSLPIGAGVIGWMPIGRTQRSGGRGPRE
jgi:hypothetical protein